ncbi:hypothetical protein AOLI_G00090050 [Acnodon oligacanthus]
MVMTVYLKLMLFTQKSESIKGISKGVSGAERDTALIGLSPLVLGDEFTSRVGSQTHAGHTPHYRNHNTRAQTHAHQPGRLCCDGMNPSPQ